MTFETYLNKNPGLYDTCPDITEDTKQALFNWFRFREVCDETRFGVYYPRQINLLAGRYNSLLNIELSKFDPLVAEYRETLFNAGYTVSGNKDRQTDTSRTGKTTDGRTDTLTRQETENNTEGENTTSETSGKSDGTGKETTGGTSHDTTTGNTTGTEESATTGGNVSVSKNNPQSIAYSGAEAGKVPSLDWTYASAQAQANTTGTANTTTGGTSDTTSDGKTTGTRDTTNGETHSDTGKGTRNLTGEKTLTGTDTREISGNGTTEGTGTEKTTETTGETRNGIEKEIYTGREGLTPQEAFLKAQEYIKVSSAFAWLKSNLEVCFLGIYDI